MGGCQNYGPLLVILNIRCRIIIGIQKGTTILTTTHTAHRGYKNLYKELVALTRYGSCAQGLEYCYLGGRGVFAEQPKKGLPFRTRRRPYLTKPYEL